ncbi:hypothetical protein DA469_21540 [Bacillus subtilis]|nr:hypothetical protein DA469_21540 [Bacillus subtilis]
MSREKILKETLLLNSLLEAKVISRENVFIKIEKMVNSMNPPPKKVIFRAVKDKQDNLIDIEVVEPQRYGKEKTLMSIQNVFTTDSIENTLSDIEASFKLANEFKPIFKKATLRKKKNNTEFYFSFHDNRRVYNLETEKWEKMIM